MAKIAVRIAPFGKYRRLISKLNRMDKILGGRPVQKATKELASAARDFIVYGIESRRQAWSELSEMTKRLKGHDRILVDKGSFVGAMKTWKEGKRWFAGLPEGAVGSDGQSLSIVGAVHESGATVEVTEDMRKFFVAKGFPLRSDTKFIIIPPRPWFAPAVEELEEYADEVLEPMANEIMESLRT